MKTVTTYDEVLESIRAFNEGIARGDAALIRRLSFNRAWYYAPELKLVGPSKFIGYGGMTAERYAETTSLDGKVTEPVLQQWFQTLDPASAEAAWVRAKVEELLAPFGKAVNKAVRFCARPGWKVGTNELRSETPGGRGSRSGLGRRTILATVVRGETHFVAQCEQLAVVTQGLTVDETLENLREAVALHLDGEDLAALGLADDPVVVVSMELLPWAA